MNIAFGISWDDKKKTRTKALAALTAAFILLGYAPALQASGERLVSVIVRALPGSAEAAESAVESAGGRVGERIGIIGGFVAAVPAGSMDRVRGAQGVHSVTVNGRVRFFHSVDEFDAQNDQGSMYTVAQQVAGAAEFWKAGLTGKGVDVALVDTGVAPVNGLSVAGKVVNGPDLSFESQAPNLRHLDTYGHGTHMAGIIAGRDDAVASVQPGNHDDFMGVAPDARIVSLKVAEAGGATDVSQVIAAIDWVVQHRRDDGMNIRVMNLSFGTDGIQSYLLDPLAYAVEVAWKKGIVVVVSAGNLGEERIGLTNPAVDPYVIAVGADDPKGTADVGDDEVPSWSSRGDGVRNPDLIAPGKSVVGLKVPGSHIDLTYPEGRVGTRFFKGSGTSQAAAMVSGAAALVIQQRPNITPDQLKALLRRNAVRLPYVGARAQGAGMMDLQAVRGSATPLLAGQTWAPATGLGSLEQARGSLHVADEGVELVGEQDIFGEAWDGRSWSVDSYAGRSWSGDYWRGRSWSGTWTGDSWAGRSWSGRSWSGNSWDGRSWSGEGWDGRSWSGRSWSGRSWSSRSWSSAMWN